MTKVKIIRLGSFQKIVLKDKWLLKIESNTNYTKSDVIGRIVLDEKRKRIGKVLDIIGNINSPYALVMPFPNAKPSNEVYVEIVEHRGKRR
ncbi:H/ACA RNA-protein complex protein Gar1 [Acidianus sulfidivorans JP7]|uniref:H/ACA RNA-protein complex protein Gar1 n=1 Tax=Acidianus sulfidivorans JP7 TaxID=619593 RepID=A0A2U9IP69_9CREN|nr:H/ACA RNA-protein complex protein Gar1 [Acidianus sulfidivorans]AWR97801.1 H/ACA RNA-protein complex protein Gar1 [Acidianus sulfidivorans JP7]